MVLNATGDPQNHAVILRATYRGDVASRMWFELEWTGEDEERHSVQSQEFDLLLWRAAQAELQARQDAEYRRRDIVFCVGEFGHHCEDDPTFTSRLDAHMDAVRKGDNSRIMEVYNKATGEVVLIARDGYSFVPQGEG
jgi:hypothetical protein